MAAFFENKLVLPIGCTCISEWQLQRTPGARQAPYFFDWAGATIDATIEILNRSGAPFLEHAGDLELYNGRVRAKSIPGAHFWHINWFLGLPDLQQIFSLANHAEGVEKFIHYHRMVMSRFNSDHDEIHCLWNNVQPNLIYHAGLAGEPRSAYFLTAERYEAIKESCKRLRARKIAVWFACHKDDVEGSLVGNDDVTVLDLPRSSSWNFKGPSGLFDPVLEKMGISRAALAVRQS